MRNANIFSSVANGLSYMYRLLFKDDFVIHCGKSKPLLDLIWHVAWKLDISRLKKKRATKLIIHDNFLTLETPGYKKPCKICIKQKEGEFSGELRLPWSLYYGLHDLWRGFFHLRDVKNSAEWIIEYINGEYGFAIRYYIDGKWEETMPCYINECVF